MSIRTTRLFSKATVSLMLYVSIGGAFAGDWDKSTTVRFNEPIRIGKTLLAPGGYVLELAPLTSDRHVLQVFSAESGRAILTTIAIPEYRTTVTTTTELRFWEGAGGEAPALRSWFYSNDNYGLGFPNPQLTPSESGLPIPRSSPQLGVGSTTEQALPKVSRTNYPGATKAPFPQLQPSDLAVRWQQLGSFSEKSLIAVGVSHPLDRRLALQFAAKDAEDVVRALTNPSIGRFRPDSDHIRLLIDQDATRDGIEKEIRNIGLRTSERSLTVVFLSLHGIEEVSSGRRYLSTFDTDLARLSDTAFDMATFVERLEYYIAGRIVLITDVCLGTMASRLPRKGLTVPTYPRMTDRTIVLSSSFPNEDSYESPRLHNSFFTYYFLLAFYQRYGLIDLNGIYAFVLQYVPAAVWAESRLSQHPTMYPAHVTSRIVLGEPEGEK